MELDTNKIDDAVLALLYLGLHNGARAWKGFDWEAMNRLHEQGYITDLRGKAKSVVFTEEGFERAAASPARLSSDDEAVLRQLRSLLARRALTSGFADSVLRQWEESGRITAKQLAAVHRLVARVQTRAAVARVVSGGSRKPGSHRSNW
jgi:hypothetical protein